MSECLTKIVMPAVDSILVDVALCSTYATVQIT